MDSVTKPAMLSSVATIHAETTDDVYDHDDTSCTTAEMYGYGTASVAIISLMSLAGILLFPTLKSKSCNVIMQFFIALAIGTMTSDALIHIIPTVLGIHDHEGIDNDEEDEDKDIWKMSMVYFGLYAFFFFENGMKTLKRTRAQVQPHQQESDISSDRSSGVEVTVFANGAAAAAEGENNDSMRDMTASETMLNRNDIVCCNCTATLITVFVGDMLHNFADGIAIGVSFAESWTTGLGTSLAILCHEIPHEFGDFAIYLNNGATKWKATALNLAAACCAFLGLYAGIGLANFEAIKPWLLALVAGMFLYISLVQVMSPMMNEETSKPLLQFLLQNIGMLLGWAILLVIALYEHDIEESFS